MGSALSHRKNECRLHLSFAWHTHSRWTGTDVDDLHSHDICDNQSSLSCAQKTRDANVKTLTTSRDVGMTFPDRVKGSWIKPKVTTSKNDSIRTNDKNTIKFIWRSKKTNSDDKSKQFTAFKYGLFIKDSTMTVQASLSLENMMQHCHGLNCR